MIIPRGQQADVICHFDSILTFWRWLPSRWVFAEMALLLGGWNKMPEYALHPMNGYYHCAKWAHQPSVDVFELLASQHQNGTVEVGRVHVRAEFLGCPTFQGRLLTDLICQKYRGKRNTRKHKNTSYASSVNDPRNIASYATFAKITGEQCIAVEMRFTRRNGTLYRLGMSTFEGLMEGIEDPYAFLRRQIKFKYVSEGELISMAKSRGESYGRVLGFFPDDEGNVPKSIHEVPAQQFYDHCKRYRECLVDLDFDSVIRTVSFASHTSKN